MSSFWSARACLGSLLGIRKQLKRQALPVACTFFWTVSVAGGGESSSRTPPASLSALRLSDRVSMPTHPTRRASDGLLAIDVGVLDLDGLTGTSPPNGGGMRDYGKSEAIIGESGYSVEIDYPSIHCRVPFPDGTPAYCRFLDNPIYGNWSSDGAVGRGTDYLGPAEANGFLVPTHSTEHPEIYIYNFYFDPPPTRSDAVALEIAAYIVETSATAAMAATLLGVPDLESRKAAVSVEYLPGNSLYGTPPATHTFPSGFVNPSAIFYAGWDSDGDPGADSPGFALFGLQAPLGPIRVSLHLDGYTTDSAVVNVVNHREFIVPLALEALPGGGQKPSEFAWYNRQWPPPGFVRRLGEVDKILGVAQPIFPFSTTLDENSDGICDVGDLLAGGHAT